jgi:hypothetical protein
MRKLLWVIFVIPFAAHAQFNKGDKYIGASISGFNGSSFGAAPYFGYFINQHTSVGAYVRASSSHQSVDYGQNQSVTDNRYLNAAVTARRWYTLSDKFYFALQGEAFYFRQVATTKDNDNLTSSNKYYGLGLNVIPTFLYFPIPRLGVEASVGSLTYQFLHELSSGDATYHQVNLGLGSVNLGVAYYFRK